MTYGQGITISTGFDVGASTPIDNRTIVGTIADRDAININILYEGIVVYVIENKLHYQYVESAWVIAGDGYFATKEEIKNLVAQKGETGQSAYELAVEGGFIGTEVQWIESLQGTDGTNGEVGAVGAKGERGEIGVSGSSLEFRWEGVQLGIRTEGETEYMYTDLGSRQINQARIRSLCGVTNCGEIGRASCRERV